MRSLACSAVLFTVICAIAAGSGAADGGPSPGTLWGGGGLVAPGGAVRYVALPGDRSTAVAVVRVRDGQVVRYNVVPGSVGVPLVAFDGSTGGLSADGSRLVLASALTPSTTATTFRVIQTRNLSIANTITLHGSWSFDAVSPDGATIFAIQYSSNALSYRVRAIDALRGRVRPGAIVDRRDPGVMRGSPTTRIEAAGSAYTLYARPNGTAFVHALDTVHAAALCLDLPWPPDKGSGVWHVRLSLTGHELILGQPGVGTLARIDLRSHRVQSVRRPLTR